MADLGLIQGFSAQVPLDDYWRRKEYDIRLDTLEQQKALRQKAEVEKFKEKVFELYSEKVDQSLAKRYEDAVAPKIKSIIEQGVQSGGVMTYDMAKELQQVKDINNRYSNFSTGIKEIHKVGDNNLTDEGRWLKSRLGTMDIDELQKEYAKQYPDSQRYLPFNIGSYGEPDFSNFVIKNEDIFKGVRSLQPKAVEIKRLNQNGIIKDQSRLYVPQLETDNPNNPFETKEGQIKVALLDPQNFRDYHNQSASYLQKEFDKLSEKDKKALSSNEDAILQWKYDKLVDKAKKEVVTKESISFSNPLQQGGVKKSNGTKTNNSEEDFYNTLNSQYKVVVSAIDPIIAKTGVTANKKAIDVVQAYGTTLGVGTGNWAKSNNESPIIFVLPNTPKAATEFSKFVVPSSTIVRYKDSDGKIYKFNIDLIAKTKGLNGEEKAALDLYFNNGVKGNLQEENVIVKKGDKNLLLKDVKKDVANNVNPFLGSKAKLNHIFTLNSEGGSDELKSAIKKLGKVKFVSQYDVGDVGLTGFNSMRSDKQNVVRGKQQSPTIPQPDVEEEVIELK